MESRAGRIEAEEAKALHYFWINFTVFIYYREKKPKEQVLTTFIIREREVGKSRLVVKFSINLLQTKNN